MTIVDEHVGVSLATAARVIDANPARLRRWAESGLVTPTQVDDRHSFYDFNQLVELATIAELERRARPYYESVRPGRKWQHGFIRKLRGLIETIRRDESIEPLRELRWAVDNQARFYYQHPDGSWNDQEMPRQNIFRDTLDLDEIRASVRRSLERPADTYGKIERRRGVRQSAPVFAGTSTPVDAVRSYLDRGHTDERILAAYPHLTPEDIDAARRQPA